MAIRAEPLGRRVAEPEALAADEPLAIAQVCLAGDEVPTTLSSGRDDDLRPAAPVPPGVVYRSSMSLAEKLHPDRFTDMSGRRAAIVAYVIGEPWTEPAITALSVTSDGFVTTEAEFMGEAADLDRNLLNLLVAAELSNEERAEFERLYRERVDDWRPILSGPMPVTARLTRPDFGAPGVPA